MALTGNHTIGSGNHTVDHNLIDAALSAVGGFPSGISGAGRYDPKTSVYVPPGAYLNRFRARLAAAVAGTATCEVLCAGPSTTMGVPNAMLTQSYPAYLRTRLNSRGLSLVMGDWVSVVNSTSGPGTSQQDSRWSASTGWAQFSPIPMAFIAANASAAAGRTLTFTSTNAGTVIEFLVVGASGQYTYSIDGGAAVTVPTQSGSSYNTPVVVTGLANTTHSVTLTSTASYMYPSKARVRPATGLTVANFGYSGSRLTDWDTTTSGTQSGLTLIDLAFAGTTYDLTIFDASAWGNDWIANNSYTPAQAQAALVRIIGQLRSHGTDVVLLNSTAPSNTVPFGSNPVIPDATYQSFRSAIYAVADATTTILLDEPERDGNWATANANGLKADAFHFTPTGYAAIACGVEQIFA